MSIDLKTIQPGQVYWMVVDNRPKEVTFTGMYKATEAYLITGSHDPRPKYYDHVVLFLTERDCLRFIIAEAAEKILDSLDTIKYANNRLAEL